MMMFSTVDTRTGRFVALYLSSKNSNAKTRLAVALSRVSTLTARYTIIENILSGYLHRAVKPDDGSLELWARDNIVSALSSLSHSTEEDRRTLAAIEEKYGRDIVMERQVSNKELIL